MERIDYNIGIVIVIGVLLLVAVISTLINHRKKTKDNQTVCPACGGIGFFMNYTGKPRPPCRKCDGTGYIKSD